MDEDFQRQIVLLELGQFAQGKFPRQDGPRHAEPPGEGHAFGRGQRHLGRGVDVQVGYPFPRETDQSEILHDGRIDSGAVEHVEFLLGGGEFVGEDQHIERDVAFHAMLVKKGHQLGQIIGREILRPHARVEGGHPEVNRVGAIGDGGADAFPIAGGREEFGFHWFWLKGRERS